MATQAIARVEQPRNIRALLLTETAREYIVPCLPKGIDYERVVADTMLAVKNNPQLLKCDGETIVRAVARIQGWGLVIGETAHLVPYGAECKAMADYKGLTDLMIRSGAVRHVEARAVYARDEFFYQYGLDAELRHVPHGIVRDRGPVVAAYCILRLPFGRSSFEVMAAEDIDHIRQTYSKQWKAGPLPAWYAKKTVIRQAAKLLPKDPRLASALRVLSEDTDEEFGALAPETAPALAAAIEDEDRIEAPAAAQLTEGEAAPAAELALDDARPQPRRRNAQED